jgi:flagellar export protein FliJ
MPFRFRAQAVLDYRHQQDEAAQRQLALAQAALQSAEQALGAANEALDAARNRAAAEESRGGEVERLTWYRNWMAGLRREIARRDAVRAERHRAWIGARDQANRARRDLRAIERYRDRMLKQWEEHERRQEQKALDLLGALQYAARMTAGGGRE